jgi:hypothetical protein
VSPPKTLCAPLLFPILTKCPAHLILFELTIRMILDKRYRA